MFNTPHSPFGRADCFRFAHPAEAMLWLWHMLFCGLYTCFPFGFRCTLCGKTMPPSYFVFETTPPEEEPKLCLQSFAMVGACASLEPELCACSVCPQAKM